MKVHTIPGLGFDSNVFVLEGERPVVVDTGTGYHVEDTLRRIKEVAFWEGVDRIVLTHRHCDHVGGAAFLSEGLEAELLAPPLEAKALREADSSTGAAAFGVPLGPLEVKDLGEVLDLGGIEMEVLPTPGHTSGSVSLWHRPTGTLVCGDTIFAGGSVGRWDLETGDYKELLASVEKLASLGVESMYPGHGPAVEGDASGQVESSLAYLKRCGRFGGI